jgi:uncharacterized membrane protein
MIENPLALLAFLFGVVALARSLEKRFAVVQKVSSAVVCTLLGILLANVGVIPHESPIHEGVFRYAIPYAIVLVILSSRLKELKRAGGPLVLAFLLAGLGTFVGATAASLAFAKALGPETWKLGGAFAGAFLGGGMNFAAVGQALEVTPSLFAAASVADNLSTVPWMLAQVGLYTLLARHFRARPESISREANGEKDPRAVWTETEVGITDLSLLAAIPLAFLWVAERIGASGPTQVLCLTTLALLFAQIPALQKLRGAAVLSYFALHLFFISLGAGSNVGEVLAHGPMLFVYMIAIIAVHAAVLYGAGYLAGFDLPTITIASQAAVGGPGSALALGMAMKWHDLVTPGIIVGIFGYALGNYLGFTTAWVLRGLL